MIWLYIYIYLAISSAYLGFLLQDSKANTMDNLFLAIISLGWPITIPTEIGRYIGLACKAWRSSRG